MAGKIPIPDEMRWQAAAKIASLLPVTYGMVFRDSVGAGYDRLEQQVFVALAHEAKGITQTFSLPVGTARDLVATLADADHGLLRPGDQVRAGLVRERPCGPAGQKVSPAVAGAGAFMHIPGMCSTGALPSR